MPDDLLSLDLDAITDPVLRSLIARLVNLYEEALATIGALQAENVGLVAEILRLKGQQPPHPKPPKDPPAGEAGEADTGASGAQGRGQNHSSETARKPDQPSQRGKGKRGLRRTLPIDQTVRLDPPSDLPADAVFKGVVASVVQEIVCLRQTVQFLRPKYYSASNRKTYLTPLPPGCRSGYGPGLQSQVLELNYGANVTIPQLLAWLTRRGISIAKGTLTGLLTRGFDQFATEAAEVWAAGLRSTPWQQLDVTSTPVGGAWEACHVLGNPFYQVFRTVPSQSRLALLETLRGGRPLRYRLDDEVFRRLTETGVSERILACLQGLPDGPEWDEAGFSTRLAAACPRLGAETRDRILEAAALAAYWADPDWPVIACLLADDAAAIRELTAELSLCWIHDGRHYTKLAPAFELLRQELAAFQARYWAYYRKLGAYREAPSPSAAAALAAEFDTLFQAGQYHYAGLERCIARTRNNKEKLLLVLRHPELPLHNNDEELAARTRVIKRRVSHGPKSAAGALAWDLFHTLAATAAKLGVNFADFLEDRLRGSREVPWLPDLIRQRAEERNLGASWAAT